jgi:hypothetical protein
VGLIIPTNNTQVRSALLAIFSFFASSHAVAYDSGESCYELNKRFGRCVQAATKGEECRPEDDFVMPERCRGGGASDQGLRDGFLENSKENGGNDVQKDEQY